MPWWKRLFLRKEESSTKSLEAIAGFIITLVMDGAKTVVKTLRDHVKLRGDLDEENSKLLLSVCASVLVVVSQRLVWDFLVESDSDAKNLEQFIYDAFAVELVQIGYLKQPDIFSYVTDYVAQVERLGERGGVEYVGNVFVKQTGTLSASLAFHINNVFNSYLRNVHIPTVKRVWQVPVS